MTFLGWLIAETFYTQMYVLHVETGRLQPTESRLQSPPFSVQNLGIVTFKWRDEDDQALAALTNAEASFSRNDPTASAFVTQIQQDMDLTTSQDIKNIITRRNGRRNGWWEITY